MTQIYINDLQDDATYNRNPQAYKLACELRDELSVIVEQPKYIRVFTPTKANRDLLVNNQYRIAVLVHGVEGALLVSGELVDSAESRLGIELAKKIWREVAAASPTPPPSTTAP